MRPARRPALAAAFAALLLAAPPALGWGDDAHFLITREAVARLPEPLRGLFTKEGGLERLEAASIAPDQWRAEEREREVRLGLTEDPHYAPAERPKHFFDIDAAADLFPYPFTNFPHDRAEAEHALGPDRLGRIGTGPWTVAETLGKLADALARGSGADVVRMAGALSHYAADLHMPFHVTANYDGQLTGNPGIHRALEIGLIKRYLAFYEAEVRKGREKVAAICDPRDTAFEWVLTSYDRTSLVLEADTIARRSTGYNPKDHERAEAGGVADLDNVESEQARPYYARLKEELDRRGAPEAAAMREAAEHVAQLLYTAYVAAGEPAGWRMSERARDAAERDGGHPVAAVWAWAATLGAAAALAAAAVAVSLRRRSKR
jgi:hypothetical protein